MKKIEFEKKKKEPIKIIINDSEYVKEHEEESKELKITMEKGIFIFLL